MQAQQGAYLAREKERIRRGANPLIPEFLHFVSFFYRLSVVGVFYFASDGIYLYRRLVSLQSLPQTIGQKHELTLVPCRHKRLYGTACSGQPGLPDGVSALKPYSQPANRVLLTTNTDSKRCLAVRSSCLGKKQREYYSLTAIGSSPVFDLRVSPKFRHGWILMSRLGLKRARQVSQILHPF